VGAAVESDQSRNSHMYVRHGDCRHDYVRY